MYVVLICVTLWHVLATNAIEDIPGCMKLEGFDPTREPDFEFEEMPPCFCDDINGLLNVTCMFGSKMSDVKEVLNKVKKAGRSVVYQFSSKGGEWRGEVEPITKSLFEGLRINRLEIQYCESNELFFEPDALVDLNGDLTHIHIDSCRMGSIGFPKGMPRELPTALRNLTSLTEMKIIRCRLERISAGSFVGFNRLKNLILPENSIIEFEKDAFQGAIVLQALDIKHNGALNNTVFEAINGAPSLEFISIQNAKLGDLPAGFLDNLVNLVQLQLLQSVVTSVPSYAFKSLKNMKLLDLRINHINTIANNAFDGLSSLKELHMDGNFMKDVPADAFKGLDSLQRLGLSYCDFKILRKGMFSDLKKLKVLELWNNLELMDIEDGAFDGLDNLTDLLLARTQELWTIRSGAFRGLPKLRVLDVSGGYIRQIVNGSFDPLVSLEMLLINGTSLITIPEGLLNPIRNTLKYIDFSQNYWECDQFFAWFPDWINALFSDRRNNDNVLIVANWQEATCHSPSEFKGIEVVKLTTERILNETYDVNATMVPFITRPALTTTILTPMGFSTDPGSSLSERTSNPTPGEQVSGMTSHVTKVTKAPVMPAHIWDETTATTTMKTTPQPKKDPETSNAKLDQMDTEKTAKKVDPAPIIVGVLVAMIILTAIVAIIVITIRRRQGKLGGTAKVTPGVEGGPDGMQSKNSVESFSQRDHESKPELNWIPEPEIVPESPSRNTTADSSL